MAGVAAQSCHRSGMGGSVRRRSRHISTVPGDATTGIAISRVRVSISLFVAISAARRAAAAAAAAGGGGPAVATPGASGI